MNYLISFGFLFGYLISLGYSADPETLLLVQTIWRNGARAPLGTFKNDPKNEWNVAPGELTELGMRQHLNLGQMLRDIYVTERKFLNTTFRNNEIYIRSADINRTMTSATSNILGMYLNSLNYGGYSYPNTTDWPKGYFPMAVHTVRDFYDYTLNPDRICLRFDELKNKIAETPQYLNLTAEYKTFLEKLSSIVGETVNLSDISKIADILSNEKMSNKTMVGGIDDDMFNEIIKIAEILDSWENGLNLPTFDGVNFSIEIPKIRAGNLLWSIIENMQMKRTCYTDSSKPFCPFFVNLKYYAYSAQDTTIAALFSTLKLNYSNWNKDGYPQYSSAVTIELWRKDDGTDYVKFSYFQLETEDSHKIEDLIIPECKTLNTTMCSLDVFANYSIPYKPLPDSATLCNTHLGDTSSVLSTTQKADNNLANSFSAVLSFIPIFFALLLNN